MACKASHKGILVESKQTTVDLVIQTQATQGKTFCLVMKLCGLQRVKHRPMFVKIETSLNLATAGDERPVKLTIECHRWRPPLLYQARRSLPEHRSELRKALTQLWGKCDPLPHYPKAALTHTLTPSHHTTLWVCRKSDVILIKPVTDSLFYKCLGWRNSDDATLQDLLHHSESRGCLFRFLTYFKCILT